MFHVVLKDEFEMQMCTQLGTRKEGEKSAYSVFNDNFETLPGQLTADRINRELRHDY